MGFRNREPLVSFLIETGLNLLDSLRDRLPDNVDDIKREYGILTVLLPAALVVPASALRGEEDSENSAKPSLLRLEWALASESVC